MRIYKSVILPLLYILLKFVCHISGTVTRERDAEEQIETEQRRNE